MNFTDNPQTLSKLLANSFLFCLLTEVLTGSKLRTMRICVFIFFYFPHTAPVKMLINNMGKNTGGMRTKRRNKSRNGWRTSKAAPRTWLNIGGLRELSPLKMGKRNGVGGGGREAPSCLGIWLRFTHRIYETTRFQVSEILKMWPWLNGSEIGFPPKFGFALQSFISQCSPYRHWSFYSSLCQAVRPGHTPISL